MRFERKATNDQASATSVLTPQREHRMSPEREIVQAGFEFDPSGLCYSGMTDI